MVSLLGQASVRKKTQKIWDNEFIDLKLLLPNHFDDPVSVTFGAGSINFQHGNKPKSPLTIYQWTDAFLIFSCIFLQKFPSEAPNLVKYCSIVREIYTLSSDGAWRTYDENFRRLRQSFNLPWQNPVEELRIKAMSKSKGQNTNDSSRKSKQFNKGGKVCFAYNRGDK